MPDSSTTCELNIKLCPCVIKHCLWVIHYNDENIIIIIKAEILRNWSALRGKMAKTY